MLSFVLKKFFSLIPALIGLFILTFMLIYLTPGDPVDALLGDFALPADKEKMREAMGLTRPAHVQLWMSFKGVLSGDLGTSFKTGEPVAAVIGSRLPSTILLGFGALAFAVPLGFLLGFLAASHKMGFLDKFSKFYITAAFCMPSFWFGPILILVFSVWWPLFPLGGQDGFSSLILPSITLGLGMSAVLTKLVRDSILETGNAAYVKLARSKGLSEDDILTKHVWPNVRIPIFTMVFLQMGALLTGAILTEAIFQWPGVGSLLIESIHSRDYPTLQGCVLFVGFVYMFMNFLSDIVAALLDPRILKGE